MARDRRSAEELSIEELEALLARKKLEARQARLRQFRRSGRALRLQPDTVRPAGRRKGSRHKPHSLRRAGTGCVWLLRMVRPARQYRQPVLRGVGAIVFIKGSRRPPVP